MNNHRLSIVAAVAALAVSALGAEAGPLVRLLPGPFLDNLKRERAVMESLDPLNLTWMFRVTAGFDDVSNTNFVQRLGGWEKPGMELRGHTLGHWLSGMASLYEATGDKTLVDRAATDGWTRLAKPPPHKKVWDDASHPAEPYWGEPNFKTPSGLVVSPLWTIHGERYVVYWN